jgi:hypothetical protein
LAVALAFPIFLAAFWGVLWRIVGVIMFLPCPRFSLRTLLVVVTVVCGILGWLEWNRRIVRERFAFIPSALLVRKGNQEDLPIYRRWLGDIALGTLEVEENDLELAEKLFPEVDNISVGKRLYYRPKWHLHELHGIRWPSP